MSGKAKKCRYCGATLLGKGKFCVECGKSTEPEKTKCPKCGFEIKGKIKFCPDCGHAFAEQGIKDNADSKSDFVLIPGQNYRMCKHEVTQELYQKVMRKNPSEVKEKRSPVKNVSWYDAIVFCNRLSEKEGREPVYSIKGNTDTKDWGYIPHKGNKIEETIKQSVEANGYRLPTTMEWHYAARGGNDMDEVEWYHDNSSEMKSDVKQKEPNGYGLYNMSGNVEEWCCDSSHGGYWCRCGIGSWEHYAKNLGYMDDILIENLSSCGNGLIGFRLVCKA